MILPLGLAHLEEGLISDCEFRKDTAYFVDAVCRCFSIDKPTFFYSPYILRGKDFYLCDRLYLRDDLGVPAYGAFFITNEVFLSTHDPRTGAIFPHNDNVYVILHELRHAWQLQHAPSIFWGENAEEDADNFALSFRSPS